MSPLNQYKSLKGSRPIFNGPAEGAVVRLRGGDYDSLATTDAEGVFAFDPVPARGMNISATLVDYTTYKYRR